MKMASSEHSRTLTFVQRCLFVMLWRSVSADNILLLPVTFTSHLMQSMAIGKKLTERGHQVTMVVSPTYPDFQKIQDQCNFEVLGYSVPDPDWYTQTKTSGVSRLSQQTHLDMYRYAMDPFMGLCSNMMKDEALITSLKRRKFAIALVDSTPASRCLMVMPYRLDVPYVSFTVAFEPWLQRLPALPSVVPFQYAQFYTENMSLWERIHNTWLLIKWAYVSPDIPMLSDKFFKELTTDKPFISVSELAAKSELWLIDSDILLDYARPMMPNEVFVGGILTKDINKLEDDLQVFMDSAVHGVIIVSFGGFDSLPPEYLEIFLDAFNNIPQNVVLRTIHGDHLKDISPRVKVMKWIPQNDLLGHPHTSLFITHCGGNSQFQALYHAVPMIGFPSFADQHYNARRMKYHGYGIYLALPTLKPDDLVFWINEIVQHNTSYKDNIQKASVLFHSRPEHPLDRVADSLEYVIRYGGDHLKSHAAYNLAWYEYLMLDILAVVTVITLAVNSCLCGIMCYFCQRQKCTTDKLKKP